jgi:hypothetical protein
MIKVNICPNYRKFRISEVFTVLRMLSHGVVLNQAQFEIYYVHSHTHYRLYCNFVTLCFNH